MRGRGLQVEVAARDFLIGHDLRPVAANVGYRFGELDLVMQDGAALVFVEVRFRGQSGFGGGAASITAAKQRKLILAADAFLAQHREWRDAACRFDVVEASGEPASPSFRWIKDAFRADG